MAKEKLFWAKTHTGAAYLTSSRDRAKWRDATPEEIAAHESEMEQRKQEADRQAEREAKQDWKDAALIMSALEHEREIAIAKIGADELARIAKLLRD